jgi:F-type H+-transporting ATPase subunit b
MTTAYQETVQVPEWNADAGMPQMHASSRPEAQLVWLALTFVFLFFIVSRVVLPRVGRVMDDREEGIASNLDTAERLRAEAESVKATYEESLASARKAAHDSALAARDDIQATVDKKQSELEARLSADAAAAEERIAAATKDALAGLDEAATEVTADLVAKLSGENADTAAVAAAVKAAREA